MRHRNKPTVTQIVPLFKEVAIWEAGINVVPKREPGGRKKLSTQAQQKTHAY